MRVLILHSDVAPDARPDEQDTLAQVAAVERALLVRGHETSRAVFVSDPAQVEALLAAERPDVVFNLVESVWGSDLHAALVPAILTRLGVPFTGSGSAAISACGDKVLTKLLLRGARLPTPAWSLPPDWEGIGEKGRWIVKSVSEDASLGLDDDAVVSGRNAVAARAQASAVRHGGRWFAERYIEGREFNVALVERQGAPCMLPIAELVFERWSENRPRIVGYAAKWDETTPEYRDTTRVFGWERDAPRLRENLERLAKSCWHLFGLKGYARVDFRVAADDRPYILEINPNPCLEPGAGLAASAAEAGHPYVQLVDDILRAALHG